MSKDSQNDPVDNIDEFVSDAIDELEKADEEIQTEDTTEPETDQEEPEEAEKEKAAKTDKESDDDGLIADDDGDEQSLDDDGEEESADKLEAPEHWAEKDKEVFNSQTKEAQEWLLDRHKAMEGDYTRNRQEFAFKERQFDAIEDALKPYQQEFQRAGLDYAGAVRQLASWDTALRQGGRDAVMQLAQAYNIDLNEPESDEYIDPQVKSVQDEIKQLKTLQSQQLQAAQQQRQQQILTTIESFRTATDEQGNLAHPHFDTLQNDITQLWQAGMVNNLDDGYRKALALHPELNKPVVKAESKPSQVDKVRQAKKAATGVKSSGAVGKKVRDKMTLEEEIASFF